MAKFITKKEFLEIFSKQNYRRKLDQILLSFFGLEASKAIEENEIEERDITIEIILMINTEKVCSILIKDTQLLLKASKKIYLNLSYREVNKHYELLIPCYFEVYIPYSYKHLKEDSPLFLLAGLFYCESLSKTKSLLKKIKIFNNAEIEDILKIIKK